MGTFSYVLDTCNEIKKKRSITEVFLKLTEEVGELGKEINIENGFIDKEKGPDGITGEAVDVILCGIDILNLSGYSEYEIFQLVREKCLKWKQNP